MEGKNSLVLLHKQLHDNCHQISDKLTLPNFTKGVAYYSVKSKVQSIKLLNVDTFKNQSKYPDYQSDP